MTCQPTMVRDLPPFASDARSCELVLEDGDAGQVVSIDYGTTVTGTSIRQAPRTALSFFANDDAPIGASAVRVEVLGDGEFAILTTQCFDGDGQPLSSSTESVDG